MNVRALLRKAWRRLSGKSASADERKVRRAAKRGAGRDKKKGRTKSDSPPS